jgi:peptidoglycan/LPS O-acetylase OafA/YrhL
MVLGNHFVIDPHKAGIFEGFATIYKRIGLTGVDLFFVLSGFLIGGLLFREIKTRGSLDVKRFLTRRIWKIWPVYYLFLAVLVVILTYQNGRGWGDSLQLLVPNLLNVQNYNPKQQGIAMHTWSLAIEEHFYLILPFVLLLLARGRGKGLHWIPWIAIGLNVICLLLRLQNMGQPWHIWTHHTPTHLRIDSLFMGVLLGYWYHLRPEVFASIARHRGLLLFLGLLLVSPLCFLTEKSTFTWTIGYTTLYLGYACLLVVFVSTQRGEGLLGKWIATRSAGLLAFVGTLSYSMYIWHAHIVEHPVKIFFSTHLLNLPATLRWLIATPLYVCLTVLVGWLSAILVEQPMLKLRDRLFPARASALPVAKTTTDELQETAEPPELAPAK